MRRVKILKKGVVTNSAEHPAATFQDWIDQGVAQNWWGKPERWVREGEEDISKALETRQVEISGPVLDEQGNVVEPAKFVTEYKLAAEYTIEIEDITGEVATARARENAKKEAQERLDALNVQAKLASANTVAALRLAVQEILADLVELRKR